MAFPSEISGMTLKEEAWSAAMRAERRGDAASYEWLLGDISARLRPSVRGRVRQLGLPPDDVEDILQEVLIGLHAMRRRWDESRPFLPWLHAILRYKLTDSVRRRAREKRVRADLSAEEWGDIVDETAQTEDALTKAALERALSTLPAGQRHVIEAVAIDGTSVRETATELRVSEGAIRMTMHRALARLAAFAENAGNGHSRGRK
jgi:RNA polymerase sigma-70 factor (ECF subfamily)